MIGSLICLIISILFRITIETLVGTKFEFLADYTLYANIICIGCAAIFLYFAILGMIMGIYKIEAKKLLLSYDGEQAPAIYRLEYLAEAKKPRRGLFRRNRAMKAMDEQLARIIDKYFDNLTEQFEAEEQPHAESLPETLETPAAQLEATEQPVAQIHEEPAPETLDPEYEAKEQFSEQQPIDPLPETPPKKKHKRGNTQPKESQQAMSEALPTPSNFSEQSAAPLQLEEVPTDGGAQIRLQIP